MTLTRRTLIHSAGSSQAPKTSFSFHLVQMVTLLPSNLRHLLIRLWIIFAVAVLMMMAGCTTTTRSGVVGVDRSQLILVSAEAVEYVSSVSYVQEYNQASAQGQLVTGGKELRRLEQIATRLVGQTNVFRDDANRWNWQLMLIDDPTLNASCRPGGRITFFTGIIRRLNLTDDEIAAVMGHEMAHALREHGRENMSENYAKDLLTIGALIATRNQAQTIGLARDLAHVLFTLPNSRQQESEADAIGLELAARAGYDPRGAVSLWRKMATASQGQEPVEFLSTHPSHATRMNEISGLLSKVVPLYEAASGY